MGKWSGRGWWAGGTGSMRATIADSGDPILPRLVHAHKEDTSPHHPMSILDKATALGFPHLDMGQGKSISHTWCCRFTRSKGVQTPAVLVGVGPGGAWVIEYDPPQTPSETTAPPSARVKRPHPIPAAATIAKQLGVPVDDPIVQQVIEHARNNQGHTALEGGK